MLKEWKSMEKPTEEELIARLTAAREKLMKQQMQVKEQKVPVLVLVEGWGTSGKGVCIGQIIKRIRDYRYTAEDQAEKYFYSKEQNV